jgi:hypothetical protein
LFRLTLNCSSYSTGMGMYQELYWQLVTLTRTLKCRTSFASFQAYVQSAHNQFPVGLSCACDTQISHNKYAELSACHLGVRTAESCRWSSRPVSFHAPFLAQAANALFIRCIEWHSTNRRFPSSTGRRTFNFILY